MDMNFIHFIIILLIYNHISLIFNNCLYLFYKELSVINLLLISVHFINNNMIGEDV